ncbi:MAG: AMP-binding protein [Aquisalimonadaceae bacterium]
MPNGMSGSLSYAQVEEMSDAFALYLRESLGLRQGARVAVQMPNCLSYPVAAMGILKAGCVLVNTNPLYTEREMEHQFRDSGAECVVIIDLFADKLERIIDRTDIRHVIITSLPQWFPPVVRVILKGVLRFWNRVIPDHGLQADTLAQALDKGRRAAAEGIRTESLWEPLTADDMAVLQYTGGTTGVSKGAILSHGNLLANIRQIEQVAGSHVRNGKECVLTALPLYHIFAFTLNMLAFYQLGARNILVPSPRPIQNLQRAMENFPISWISGVNTLYNALLNEEWFTLYPPKSLQAAIAGGTALQRSVAERWERITGCPIAEGYGLTESSPLLTFNPLGGERRINSIGIPVPDTDMRVVDDNGQCVAPGEPGELIARGPQIMQGYWNREDETAKALRDGWLYTGDIAYMADDGYFHIVDRKKDMILVSGFNVYPNEVEDCLARLDGVHESAVIGVPDDSAGEAVRAYVVKRDDSLTEEQVRAHCRKELAAYKVPKRVIFRDELPKTPVGKVLRKELRAELESAGGAGKNRENNQAA